jgi:hypothetical protein
MEASFSVVSPARKGRARFVVLQGGGAGPSTPLPSAAPAPSALAADARDHGLNDASSNAALARSASPSLSGLDDEFLDRLEVPAAVVCARCGEADCLGCDPEEERSGFLTIVPWERAGQGSSLRRLWLTAHLATQQPESFFEALPDGALVPALRFAMAAELLASTALFAMAAGAGALLLPSLASQVVASAGSLGFVLRATVVGLPTVAALLVGAHVVHALWLDRAASRAGGRSQRSRALRFGLYAAGWDVILGPIGLVVLALSGGPRAVARMLRSGGTVPARASRAFLRGAYGVVGEPAKTALHATFIGAAIATTLAALALFALGTAFVIALVTRF